ncbi:MAG: hypothetical protein A2149_07655 [Candidatus Schekmanbacteria bacterium RBG_16_38_11]|uniref:Formyltransferase n=1 Tax=Candidatus Schekmanbacteria bacterium RBG_16_38_11 TaxID=1817880 RepID=A0A1F7RSN5_9BACT|nr:MAG: hypothetical protein A2149_07655 [Candidatus Schekmanbacteria bacterium RBG_16_38_11]
MKKMRILVFGYHNVGYVCLKELIERKENVVAVFTHKGDPSENIWFNSVYELALKSNIPVFSPTDIKGDIFFETLKNLKPEIILSFYYRYLIPENILEIPAHGAINLHGSLLPKYRGRCPVNWVLINGEKTTGVTLHYMKKSADSGDIISQQEVPISEDDDALTLFNKITEAALSLFKKTWPLIKSGNLHPIPQDPSKATYFSGRKPENGLIDWKREASEIHNLIRGVTHPYPGAFTFYKGKKLFIWKSELISDKNNINIPCGKILAANDRGIEVKAGEGHLLLKSAQFDREEELTGKRLFERFNSMAGDILG